MSFIEKVNKQRHILREKEILNSLDHPHVVKLYQTFSDDEDLYFVFEHLDTGTLDDILRAC